MKRQTQYFQPEIEVETGNQPHDQQNNSNSSDFLLPEDMIDEQNQTVTQISSPKFGEVYSGYEYSFGQAQKSQDERPNSMTEQMAPEYLEELSFNQHSNQFGGQTQFLPENQQLIQTDNKPKNDKFYKLPTEGREFSSDSTNPYNSTIPYQILAEESRQFSSPPQKTQSPKKAKHKFQKVSSPKSSTKKIEQKQQKPINQNIQSPKRIKTISKLDFPYKEEQNPQIQTYVQGGQQYIELEADRLGPGRIHNQFQTPLPKKRQKEEKFGRILNSSQRMNRKRFHENQKQLERYSQQSKSLNQSNKPLNQSEQSLRQDDFNNQISLMGDLIQDSTLQLCKLQSILEDDPTSFEILTKLKSLISEIRSCRLVIEFQRDILKNNVVIAKNQIEQLQFCRNQLVKIYDGVTMPYVEVEIQIAIKNLIQDNDLLKKVPPLLDPFLEFKDKAEQLSQKFHTNQSPVPENCIMSPDRNQQNFFNNFFVDSNGRSFSQVQRWNSQSQNQNQSPAEVLLKKALKNSSNDICPKGFFEVPEIPLPNRPERITANKPRGAVERLTFSSKNINITVQPHIENSVTLLKHEKKIEQIANSVIQTSEVFIEEQYDCSHSINSQLIFTDQQIETQGNFSSLQNGQRDYCRMMLRNEVLSNEELFDTISKLSDDNDEIKFRLLDYRNHLFVSYVSLCLSEYPHSLPERLELLRHRDQQILDHFARKGIELEPHALKVMDRFLENIEMIADKKMIMSN